MTFPRTWRKSSYSDADDGNDCVEVARHIISVSVRDSKAPGRAVLTFPAEAFASFVEALRTTESEGPA
ncbi:MULTISPECIES: DUF397 domain-containing protein [unclassified Streptomyces]|uniref:DUF397 domain-containing protein n=1 Tax=unclassified Streptomyces TaxID=2593676 RepID=UPI001F048182|nr:MULTISPECIES: DUF397 domain-containing protein [unclassified Streptomyces]MCH0564324.1 DUF397 domain-containing protein [Streptomyces sp. MUM 2J]MCH0569495.1 DUF397 domain-containing protein [Streptomyces sp. MUM 136J]